MCGECVGVGVGLWWRGREREGGREGGRERERERTLERESPEGGGGARGMRWQCQLKHLHVYFRHLMVLGIHSYK